MTKRTLLAVVLFSATTGAPAAAQRLGVEPFAGWGFYGALPETSAKLEGGFAYGARAAVRVLPRWGVFGQVQRSRPRVLGTLPFGSAESGDRITVDHWSAGLEFAYAGRDPASGALPLVLQAGAGRAEYDGGPSDLAVNVGVTSAVPLSRRLVLRYSLNDYISSYAGDGLVNQVFVRIGAELAI